MLDEDDASCKFAPWNDDPDGELGAVRTAHFDALLGCIMTACANKLWSHLPPGPTVLSLAVICSLNIATVTAQQESAGSDVDVGGVAGGDDSAENRSSDDWRHGHFGNMSSVVDISDKLRAANWTGIVAQIQDPHNRSYVVSCGMMFALGLTVYGHHLLRLWCVRPRMCIHRAVHKRN
jgi:hypothetical protein